MSLHLFLEYHVEIYWLMKMENRNRSKCILIIDDEEDLVWSISKALEKNRFKTLCVNNGDHALDIMAQQHVDVVISDIRMPGQNGLQLLPLIKNNFPETAVIIMSAFSSPEIQEEALSLGAIFFIEKPFDINFFRKLIHETLNQSVTPEFSLDSDGVFC